MRRSRPHGGSPLWSVAELEYLRSEWADRPAGKTGEDFDAEFAPKVDLNPRTVGRKRRKLGLKVGPMPIPDPLPGYHFDATRLASIMREKGETNTSMGKRLGLTGTTVSRILSGSYDPTLTALGKISFWSKLPAGLWILHDDACEVETTT